MEIHIQKYLNKKLEKETRNYDLLWCFCKGKSDFVLVEVIKIRIIKIAGHNNKSLIYFDTI